MPLLKTTIKKFLKHYGYDIVRHDPIGDVPFNLFKLIVENMVINNSNPFFVQIGANNGVMGDPLYELVRRFHLKGLLVEPLPKQFAELRNSYKNESQLIFENCAISEKNGFRTLYCFQPSPKIPEWDYGMASFDKNHLIKFKDTMQFADLIEEISVPTMNISSLIQKHSIEHIDLIQIDTEGYDFNIIKMLFETEIRPFIINYEHEHLRSNEHIACKRLLLDNNYQFITYGRDVIAILSCI